MCRMICATGTYDPVFLGRALKKMAAGNNAQHENVYYDGKLLQHTHGWGAAHFADGRWNYAKSVKSVLEDPEFDVVTAHTAPATILHARYKTVGGIAPENTHPFHDPLRGIVFFHNGHIKDAVTSTRTPVGETDSERLFLRYLDLLDQGLDELSALKTLVSALSNYWGANLIVGTPTHMYVVVAHKTFPQYYSMRSVLSNEGFMVLSEPVGNDLPFTVEQNGTIRIVDLATGAVRLERL